MNEIGIFICNYNKAEMVVKCVKAIKEQTIQNFDIYVVDNASEDESVALLKKTYGDTITIVDNGDNRGGSGGFGKGIRMALELNYKYFMLVDNDAFLEPTAVEHLYRYIDEHNEVGICGAETLYLQQPDKIQDLGGKIDFVNYRWGGIVGGLTELAGNHILECDYVASCSVIARTSAVRIFGGFPEDNFIYWDDIEWCTKCWNAGFKVVVNGNAKVLHDMSGASPRNMFLRYYANRNRLKFFTKYLKKEELNRFYNVITEQIFQEVYGAMHKGMRGSVMTLWNAFDDFMHGVTGKAVQGKLVEYTAPKQRLLEMVQEVRNVLIYMPSHTHEDYEILNVVLRKIVSVNPDLNVKVQFELENSEMYDLTIQLCKHVTQVDKNILPVVYVDRWGNVIENQKDYDYFSRYSIALAGFRKGYRYLFDERVKELRR